MGKKTLLYLGKYLLDEGMVNPESVIRGLFLSLGWHDLPLVKTSLSFPLLLSILYPPQTPKAKETFQKGHRHLSLLWTIIYSLSIHLGSPHANRFQMLLRPCANYDES